MYRKRKLQDGVLVLFVSVYLFSACGPTCLHAQGWYLTRNAGGNSQAWGVDVDSLGNIYWVTCEIPLFSFWFNVTLYKIDRYGNEIWKSNPWGKTFNDYGYNVVVHQPYVYVAGRTDTSVAPESANALVLAFDMANGNLVWQYVWDGGNGYEEIDGLLVGNDGLYLTGWTQGASTQMEMDVLVQKLSFDGKLIWSTSWGGPGWDTANGQFVMDDSTIFLAGHYNGTGYATGGDAMLAAFDKDDGSYNWHRIWGGANYDDAYGMTSSPDGSLYLTGPTVIGFGTQLFTLKYTRTGDLIWNQLWGGSGGETARTLLTDGDTILYIGVNTESYGAGMNDIALLKYDSSGAVLNYKTWGGFERDVVSGMAKKEEYIYMAGNTRSFGPKEMNALLLAINTRTITFPDTTLTAVEELQHASELSLAQNYPNPFSSTTRIRMEFPLAGTYCLSVFTILGTEVFARQIENIDIGQHEIVLNMTSFPPGIYTCVLRGEGCLTTRKILLTK